MIIESGNSNSGGKSNKDIHDGFNIVLNQAQPRNWERFTIAQGQELVVEWGRNSREIVLLYVPEQPKPVNAAIIWVRTIKNENGGVIGFQDEETGESIKTVDYREYMKRNKLQYLSEDGNK